MLFISLGLQFYSDPNPPDSVMCKFTMARRKIQKENLRGTVVKNSPVKMQKTWVWPLG